MWQGIVARSCPMISGRGRMSCVGSVSCLPLPLARQSRQWSLEVRHYCAQVYFHRSLLQVSFHICRSHLQVSFHFHGCNKGVAAWDSRVVWWQRQQPNTAARVSLQHMYVHVLQCVCCSALQCVCCSVLQRETRVWCGGSASSLTLPLASQPTTYIWSCVVVCVLQCVAVWHSRVTLQLPRATATRESACNIYMVMCCSVCVAVCCSVTLASQKGTNSQKPADYLTAQRFSLQNYYTALLNTISVQNKVNLYWVSVQNRVDLYWMTNIALLYKISVQSWVTYLYKITILPCCTKSVYKISVQNI